MLRRFLAVAPVVLSLVGVACSGDEAEPSGGAGPDASGSSSGEISSGGDGGSSGSIDAGAEDCVGPAPIDLLTDTAWLQNLQAPTDELLVLVAKDGVDGRARIESLRVDGSARTTLYTDTAELTLYSMHAHAEGVFFVVRTNDPVPEYTLWSLPLNGGEPTLVASDMTGAEVIGVDADSIYVRQDLRTLERFRRLPRAGGAAVDLFELRTRSMSPRVQGSALFFRATPPEASGQNKRTYRASLSSPGEPSLVFPESQDPAPFPANLAGFFVTPTRVVSGFGTLTSAAHDGTDVRELAPATVYAGNSNVVVGARGEELVVAQLRTADKLGWLDTVSSVGENRTHLVCGVGTLAPGATPGFAFADTTAREVAEASRDVFWIETVEGSETHYKLRRATPQ